MSHRESLPSYRLHKQSGQAVVTLPDGFGSRRDVLLGPYKSAESRKRYDLVLAEWVANGRRLSVKGTSAEGELSINEVAVAYYDWAKEYHAWNKQNGQAAALRDALRIAKELYGSTRRSVTEPRTSDRWP